MTKSKFTRAILTLGILLISCGDPSSAKSVSPASSAQETGISDSTAAPSAKPAVCAVDTKSPSLAR